MAEIIQNESVKIMRSQINLAKYNPRKITVQARKKLEKNLETHGLMGGIVWNVRTGNLVSGHQRVTILDKKNGFPKKDYEIWVTKVDLDDKQEKEQNIFFNNQSAQGVYDDELLRDLMKEIDFSENAGFSKEEQVAWFGSTRDFTDDEYEKMANRISASMQRIVTVDHQFKGDSRQNYIVLVFKGAGERDMIVENLGIKLDDGRFCDGNQFIEYVVDLANGSEG